MMNDDGKHPDYYVKQILVLTHNVYFHKDLTYLSNKQKNKCASEITYWLLKKRENYTTIELKKENPIKTSYQLLWCEVKTDTPNNLTIPNTMRRILEHYFKMLGSMDLYKIPNKFFGEEKIVCKSLLKWVNSGSHSIDDDANIIPDDSQIENYKKVFKNIFKETGHEEHYNMMMGIQTM